MTSDWLPGSSLALDRVRGPNFSATLAAQEVSEEHGLWGQEGLGSNSSSANPMQCALRQVKFPL